MRLFLDEFNTSLDNKSLFQPPPAHEDKVEVKDEGDGVTIQEKTLDGLEDDPANDEVLV